jgi:hypothetical protein
LGCKEEVEQFMELIVGFGNGLDLSVVVEPGEDDFLDELTRNVVTELQVVSEDEVFEGVEVALELLAGFDFVEGDADVLALDVADGVVLAGDDEVGRAALDAFGFVRCRNALSKRLDELL